MGGKKQPERLNPECKVCICLLTDETWSPSNRKYRRYICKTCWNNRQREYQQKDPNWREAQKAKSKKYRENRDPETRLKQTRNSRCKYIRRKFGITLEEYENMVLDRKGCCDICQSQSKGRGNLHIDHCHQTGKLRGLLCMNCNVVLGLVYDKSEILNSAINYINKHSVE